MCYVLYLASDHERPEIAWDQAKPAFHVKAADLDAERARGQFTKKRVYSLGSDEGCGCGFRQQYDGMNGDPDEQTAKRENQRRLAGYLSACLAIEECVELFGCWSGSEEEAPVQEREIAVGDLLEEDFFFIEGERIRVRKEKPKAGRAQPQGSDDETSWVVGLGPSRVRSL